MTAPGRRRAQAPAGLVLEGVAAGYGGRPVVTDISLEVKPGECVGLIGPNASGKSTVLKTISRVLRPLGGRVLLDGRDVWRDLTLAETARAVAVVPQDFPADFPFTVEETVVLGRTPHLGRLQGESAVDWARVRLAMEEAGVLGLAGRPVAELAGGERQRVLVAKALAQEPRLLLLDEPTSHLDVGYQTEILDLLLRLNRSGRLSLLLVLHDLNLAAIYCDRLFLLSGGGPAGEGRPAEVLTPARIESVYGTRVIVGRHPIHDCPQVTLVSGFKARFEGERTASLSSGRRSAAGIACPERQEPGRRRRK